MVQKLTEIHKIQNYFIKLLFLTFLFCILLFGNVLCQSNIKLNFSVGAGTYFAIISKGFLEQYNILVGGKKEEFMHQFSPNIGLYVSWDSNYSVSLNASSIKFKLQENFIKETFTGSNQYRLLLEDMNITTAPIYLSIKFTDYSIKYRSFLQIGAGVAYSYVEWKESVNSPIPNDIRIGGTIFANKSYYPTMSSKIGVELLFDRESVPKFINGINLTADIVYIARYEKIFNKLIKQHYNNYQAFSEKHAIIPFMFGLNIGIILNLDNEKVNRIFGSNI